MRFSLSGCTSFPLQLLRHPAPAPWGDQEELGSPPGWGIHFALDRSPRCLWNYSQLMNKIMRQWRRPPRQGQIPYSGEIFTAALEGASMGTQSWWGDVWDGEWTWLMAPGRIPFLGTVATTKISLNHQSCREQPKLYPLTGMNFQWSSPGLSDGQWEQLAGTAGGTWANRSSWWHHPWWDA